MKSPVPVLDTLNEWRTFNPGLDRVKDVLHALGYPHQKYAHILVGGTNGKGTVSLNIALNLPGKIGLFLSPHLEDVRERITIDGKWVPDKTWREAFRLILEQADDPRLSYFEWLLVLAVVIFSMEGVDGAVFEIGLGGRWDAANALDPKLSVLTNVSLDHMEILGDSIERIALEKIEIARTGKPLFFPLSLYEFESFERRVAAIDCKPFPFTVRPDFEGNNEIVNEVLNYLGIRRRERLRFLPGRREILRQEPWLLMDGAHNQAGWQALAVWTKELAGRINILAGLSGKRDPRLLMDCLSPVARNFYVWHFDPEKMIDPDTWPADIASVEEKDFDKLLKEPLLACGSLYMIGKLRGLFRKKYGLALP